MTDSAYDVCIIGGGVVGCACLFDLTNYGYRCLLLEKNPNLVSEASSGNSGMLHTGFDTPLNSLEQECIQICQRRVFNVTGKLGIPVNHIGATMVSWDDEQLRKFPEIIEKSRQAAVSDIFQLSASELYQKEPNLQGNARGGLWIPGEAVTDPWLLPVLLANDAISKGAKVIGGADDGKVLQNDLDRLSVWEDRWDMEFNPSKCQVVQLLQKLSAKMFYLHFDQWNDSLLSGHMLGHMIKLSYPIGSGVRYLRVKTQKVEKTKSTSSYIQVYDNVIVGPTAEDVDCRTRALVDTDITEKLRQLVGSKVRGIGAYSVVGMYTGVRPATEYKDYVLKCQPDRHWITVGGIRSTGVSGSLGLSNKVQHLVTEELRLEPTRGHDSSIEKPDWHFTGRGCMMIDGRDTVITHPITYFGNKMALSRI